MVAHAAARDRARRRPPDEPPRIGRAAGLAIVGGGLDRPLGDDARRSPRAGSRRSCRTSDASATPREHRRPARVAPAAPRRDRRRSGDAREARARSPLATRRRRRGRPPDAGGALPRCARGRSGERAVDPAQPPRVPGQSRRRGGSHPSPGGRPGDRHPPAAPRTVACRAPARSGRRSCRGRASPRRSRAASGVGPRFAGDDSGRTRRRSARARGSRGARGACAPWLADREGEAPARGVDRRDRGDRQPPHDRVPARRDRGYAGGRRSLRAPRRASRRRRAADRVDPQFDRGVRSRAMEATTARHRRETPASAPH